MGAPASPDPELSPELRVPEGSLMPAVEAASEPYSPDQFVHLLETVIDDYCEDEAQTLKTIRAFVRKADVEFAGPSDEEELTPQADRAEHEISAFIDHCEPLRHMDLLTDVDLQQIESIYNPNNLLFLAKELAAQRSHGRLKSEDADMLFRYRAVLKRMAELRAIQVADHAFKTVETRVGAKTWGGYLHPYGHVIGGVIDETELRVFSESEDPGYEKITVEGLTINLKLNRGKL